jgi:hypothetical protein
MVSKHVSLVVRSELALMLQENFVPCDEVIPRVFSHPADVDALCVALDKGALRAVHSRSAADAALEAYALPFVLNWLTEKQRNASTGPQKAFADEIATNLHPAGSYFDRYMARFFEDPSAALAFSGAIVAVVVRTTDLLGSTKPRTNGFSVNSAIYEAATQRRLLDLHYERFQEYYVAAIDRFGQRHSETVLPSCCDALRATLGPLMLRLREPRRAGEREWLAVARYRKPEGYLMMNGVRVPWLGLRRGSIAQAKTLPVDAVLASERT